jgi:hypothetical protein
MGCGETQFAANIDAEQRKKGGDGGAKVVVGRNEIKNVAARPA